MTYITLYFHKKNVASSCFAFELILMFYLILFINWLQTVVFSRFVLTFKWKQDDENALLQQALAMSMDDPAVSHDVKDTDMSEASADDPELALGEIFCCLCIFHVRSMCTDMGHYIDIDTAM